LPATTSTVVSRFNRGVVELVRRLRRGPTVGVVAGAVAGVEIALGGLGGWCVGVTGGVLAVAALFGVGYAGRGHGGQGGRGVQAALPVFAAALLLVPAAASASTLLVLWELMAVTSLVLVLAEHRARPAVAEAGWWYGVLT